MFPDYQEFAFCNPSERHFTPSWLVREPLWAVLVPARSAQGKSLGNTFGYMKAAPPAEKESKSPTFARRERRPEHRDFVFYFVSGCRARYLRVSSANTLPSTQGNQPSLKFPATL